MRADPALATPPFPHPTSSLVKTHLTSELYARLKDRKTPSGFTLDRAIASGVTHPDSSVGIYAGDPESYTLFAPVFTPIIEAYHGLNLGRTRHVEEMSPLTLSPLDPGGRFIRSVRIRVARNLTGVPFSCHMSKTDRLKVEDQAATAAAGLPQALSGEYRRFSDLTQEGLDTLVARKLAFPRGDRFQEAAGMNRDFPTGRGVFLSTDSAFRIWVNEEDHLRVMALKTDSDLSGVYRLLIRGLRHLEEALSFCHDPVLGYLNACPTNVGTAMRAGAHICLPGLSRQEERLKTLARDHHLQIRGTMGEKTAVENAVFDISNARRLGISANQIITDLHTGLQAIIRAEENL